MFFFGLGKKKKDKEKEKEKKEEKERLKKEKEKEKDKSSSASRNKDTVSNSSSTASSKKKEGGVTTSASSHSNNSTAAPDAGGHHHHAHGDKKGGGGGASNSRHNKEPEEEIEVQEVTMAEVAKFFNAFRAVLLAAPEVNVRRVAVQQIKGLCPQLVEPRTRITPELLQSMEFTPSLKQGLIEFLVKEVLASRPPLRARQTLALYRFCSEMEQELEDEAFTCSTGFLAELRQRNVNLNPNLNPPPESPEANAAATPAPAAPLAAPAAPPNLVDVYLRFLQQDPAYLPTVVECQYILAHIGGVFRDEPNVVSVPLPACLVGDIHGQMEDVLRHVLPAGGPLVPPAVLEGEYTPGLPLPSPYDRLLGKNSGGGGISSSSSRASSLAAVGAGGKPTPLSPPPAPRHRNYLFLGDYVDRGSSSLRCMFFLFVAKLLSPSTVFLLRGNHECGITNRHYGFLEECHKNYPVVAGQVTQAATIKNQDSAAVAAAAAAAARKGNGKHSQEVHVDDEITEECTMEWELGDHPFWLAANKAFEALPLCGAVYEEVPRQEKGRDKEPTAPEGSPRGTEQVIRVCAMHGGLSPYIEYSFDGIVAINRFKDIESGALADLTWSDPIASRSNNNDGNPTRPSPTLTMAPTGGAGTLSSPASPLHSASFAGGMDGGSIDEDYTLAPGETRLRNGDVLRPLEYHPNTEAVCSGPPVGFTFSARGTGHNFGEDVTCSFISHNRLYYVVRAHQCVQEGYQWQHQNRLLTIFSAPNYCGLGNKGSVLLLDEHAAPSVVQYSYHHSGDSCSSSSTRRRQLGGSANRRGSPTSGGGGDEDGEAPKRSGSASSHGSSGPSHGSPREAGGRGSGSSSSCDNKAVRPVPPKEFL